MRRSPRSRPPSPRPRSRRARRAASPGAAIRRRCGRSAGATPSRSSPRASPVSGWRRPAWPARAEPRRESGGAIARGLALGQLRVAPDVAVVAARDEVDGLAVPDVLDRAHDRPVDARERALAEPVTLAVEVDLDDATVHEVELLLALVEVPA